MIRGFLRGHRGWVGKKAEVWKRSTGLVEMGLVATEWTLCCVVILISYTNTYSIDRHQSANLSSCRVTHYPSRTERAKLKPKTTSRRRKSRSYPKPRKN